MRSEPLIRGGEHREIRNFLLTSKLLLTLRILINVPMSDLIKKIKIRAICRKKCAGTQM